jgi:cobalt-zinc-cadmium efflux system protein
VTADSERRVFLVMLLTGGFMVVEAVGGLMAGSLALIADAGHMLTDTVALGMAWMAFRVGRRPSDARRSFGYHRLQVLAAFVNGLLLFAIGLWIVVEAIQRMIAPRGVDGDTMLWVAAAGLAVNVLGFAILRHGAHGDLNMRSALLHVLSDILGSVGAIVAAVVIMATGWTPVDPILSVVVALLVLRGAVDVVRQSAHILAEGAPAGIDPDELGAALRQTVPEVTDIHHVHVWSLTTERPLATLHAAVAPGTDQDAVLAALLLTLRNRFGIGHATVQIETRGCPERHRE